MSLVKSPTMSDAKIAANQANSQKSTGPVTPEGLKRMRLGRLQHGLYVPDPREVLALLGEDPDDFDRYEKALLKKWPPSDDFQEQWVRRIARKSWRLDRSGRVQESAAAQEVLALELDRAAAGERQQQRLRDCQAAIDTLLEMNRKGDFSDLNALEGACDRIYEPYGDDPPARASEVFDLLMPALASAPDQVRRATGRRLFAPAGRARTTQRPSYRDAGIGAGSSPSVGRNLSTTARRNNTDRAPGEDGTRAAERAGHDPPGGIAGPATGAGRPFPA
jgi:hypothetical protein